MATVVPEWVQNRIWELRQADVPRDEVIKILSVEGAKISTRTVSRYGGIQYTGLSPDKYAELYPDLSSKLLSEDVNVVRRAMNTAKQRRYTVENPEKIKEVSAKYRAGEAGQAYQKSYRPPKGSVYAKNARRRALKKLAITGQNFIPSFRTEVDEIYRLASLFPGEFDVDHIQRLAGGVDQPMGKHEASNLQLLRKEVHKLKTSLENAGRFEDAARVGKFNLYNLHPNIRPLLAENVLPERFNLMNASTKPRVRFPGMAGVLAAPLIWGVSSMLSGGQAQAGTAGENVKRNVSDPHWWASGVTGVDTRKLLQDMRNTKAEIDERRKNFASTWRGGNNIWNQ